jgi:hypothetical protein
VQPGGFTQLRVRVCVRVHPRREKRKEGGRALVGMIVNCTIEIASLGGGGMNEKRRER